MQRPDTASLIRYAAIAAQVFVVTVAVTIASILVVPRFAGWEVVTVLSGSMKPTYPADSVLAIASVDPSDIEQGDVIAFTPEADALMVTHRVVSVSESSHGLSFVTKGDANEDPDSNPVAASAVQGRVVFGVPMLGTLVRIAHTPVGYLALLVLPAVLVVGHEARSIWRAHGTSARVPRHRRGGPGQFDDLDLRSPSGARGSAGPSHLMEGTVPSD